MRKSLLTLLGLVAGLAFSSTVFAIGLGGINVTSALGQPLNAEIDLVAVSNSDKGSLVARLASPDAYRKVGLDYPYGIKFKFQILSRDTGETYLKVSSAESISDPYVSLLVDLSWPAGKLLREYTFLLDPPGYVPAQPVQPAAQPVAPEIAAAAPAVPVPAVPEGQSGGEMTPVAPMEEAGAGAVPVQPMEQPVSGVAESQAMEQPASAVAASQPMKVAAPVKTETLSAEQPTLAPTFVPPKENPEWIAVKRGDTMYKLAEQYKLENMNLERMLVALYRANAGKFDGRNMNRIRAGKVLKLPTDEEYESVTLADAKNEIHAQASDWNAYRQKLASAAPPSEPVQVAQQVVTGKISSSVADRAPVAKESAKEVLKLSKGEAPGDQVGAGGRSAQDIKNAAQEEAIAQQQASQEEQMRAEKLEKNLQDMQRLAQLKAEMAAAGKAAPPPPAAAPAPMAAAPVAVPAASVPAKPQETQPSKPKPKPAAKPVVVEPSLVDQLLDEPLYLAAGAALILVGGVGFVVYRRKKKIAYEEVGETAEEEVGDITGKMAAPVIPSPDTGDFTQTVTNNPAAAGQSETVDPLSEADLFLNFGRDVQAEDILKDALQSNPGNHQIHMRLLGIYANRKDANSFSSIARQLLDSGDDALWQQAAEMGRQIDPGNPMYGAGGEVEHTASATMQVPAFAAAQAAAPAVDFDFDAAASSANQGAADVADITMAADEASQTADMGMDFDVTSTHPSMSAAEETAVLSSNADEMVFDITGSQPAPDTANPDEDAGMAFTLDFPVESAAEQPAATPSSGGLGGINLNFDEGLSSGDMGSAGAVDDVSTKLDLAKAYQEMGDQDGAREILNEVMNEGNAQQQETARSMLAELV